MVSTRGLSKSTLRVRTGFRRTPHPVLTGVKKSVKRVEKGQKRVKMVKKELDMAYSRIWPDILHWPFFKTSHIKISECTALLDDEEGTFYNWHAKNGTQIGHFSPFFWTKCQKFWPLRLKKNWMSTYTMTPRLCEFLWEIPNLILIFFSI